MFSLEIETEQKKRHLGRNCLSTRGVIYLCTKQIKVLLFHNILTLSSFVLVALNFLDGGFSFIISVVFFDNYEKGVTETAERVGRVGVDIVILMNLKCCSVCHKKLKNCLSMRAL